MKAKKWGVASIRYRRRIPFLSRFSVTSEPLCHDGHWFYFLQEFHRGDRICASALMKVCATLKQGLVPATEVLAEIGAQMEAEIPDWVEAWIEAEGLRPWPQT